MTQAEAESIARLSFRNRSRIAAATFCGCFYCHSVFPGSEVRDWTDDQQTALCPRCGIDAVLAGVTNTDTLRDLHRYRFDGGIPLADNVERIASAAGNRSR